MVSEGIKCRLCSGNENCNTCVGERCLKVISPFGTILRQCINGSDPAFDFIGHKHTDEGEDAYICADKDFCNASMTNVFSSFLLTSMVLLKIFFFWKFSWALMNTSHVLYFTYLRHVYCWLTGYWSIWIEKWW